ncbi:hypothetical protein [Actinomadura sp. 3N508]|uniref:hypothetical protein n=1 Tax=Actinomadura sp. 3N508 TaxID=3375153 RepID=UPI00379FD6AB
MMPSSTGRDWTNSAPPVTRPIRALVVRRHVERVVVDSALNQVTISAVEDESGTAGDWNVGVAAVCAQ